MNKKAWLRIIEAFLAIMIILGAVFIIMSKNPPESKIDDDVYEKQRAILDLISKNDVLRANILVENNDPVNADISKMVPDTWRFATKICDLDSVCSPDSNIVPIDKDVYATEIVISSTLSNYNPKKLRFFVWMK